MKYHFIGIKGSGMSALAQIIHDLGNEVQGSDVTNHLFTQEPLEERKIKLLPFDESNINSDMIVVIGNAFRDNHPEVMKAKELGVKTYRYYELLSDLTKQYDTIAICGCHGKTTTTGLLSHVLNSIVGCNYLIGDGTGYAHNDNKYFVVESCEHKRHFLYNYPKYTIITNIELEHVDYYKDIEDIKKAFEQFGNQTKKQVIACGDDRNIRDINIIQPLLYYGFYDNNDVIAKNLVLTNTGSTFDVIFKGKNIGTYEISLFGKHMILNALSVIALCYFLDLDMEKVKLLLSTYKGAKRRFKEKVIKDLVLIDDYAHHPTEVRVTIESARQKHPDKYLVAILKPNTYSRTKMLYKDFADALNLADKAYVMDIFCDREKQEEWPGVTSKLIIDLLNNGESISVDTVDKLLIHKNTVFLFMSCKDIYVLQEKLEELLNNN